jgi:hypothetical protein
VRGVAATRACRPVVKKRQPNYAEGHHSRPLRQWQDEAIGALKTRLEAQDTRPIINIGIKVGGVREPKVLIGMEPEPVPDDVVEGEIVTVE